MSLVSLLSEFNTILFTLSYIGI